MNSISILLIVLNIVSVFLKVFIDKIYGVPVRFSEKDGNVKEPSVRNHFSHDYDIFLTMILGSFTLGFIVFLL